MENNFLSDAELPAYVADLKSLNKQIELIPSLTANIANHKFENGEIILGKNSSSNSLIKIEGQNKNFWLYNYNDELRVYSLNQDGSNFITIMQILSDGTISKIGGGSFSALSDERVKYNIMPFDDGLNKILGINPKTFNYKAVQGTPTQDYPSDICKKTQYGVIAQQIETVAPEMVTTNRDGFKSVDLSNISLLLVNAVKEQNKMILDLTARIEALETPQA